jgi:hypothetical protein
VSPRTRTLRYGAAITVVLIGVACGALIPGTAGGTAATVLVGIGLVSVVSLIFYEVGLTEDREREEGARRHAGMGAGKEAEKPEPRSPDDHDASGEHQGGRVRPLDRRRGQRRRLR